MDSTFDLLRRVNFHCLNKRFRDSRQVVKQMLKFSRNEAANLFGILDIHNLVFLLQECFNQALNHWNKVPHDFFDAISLIAIADFFPQVPNNREVLRNDVT